MILYEGLVGVTPFRGPTASATLEQVRSREPVPPRVLQPKVPRDLETICLACLRKDPAGRYGSARALADDLARFLDGRPIRARRTSRVVRAWKLARRNPWPTATAALVGLVLVAAAGYLYERVRYERDQLRKDRELDAARARTAHEQAVGTANEYHRLAGAAEAEAGAGRPGWRAKALDHVRKAVDLAAPKADPVRLRTAAARALTGLDFDELPAVAKDGSAGGLAFSPDGRTLAVTRHAVNPVQPATVYLVDVATRATTPLTARLTDTKERLRAVVFSRDGRRVAVGCGTGRVIVWDVGGGADPRVAKASGRQVEGLAFSPDGSTLAVIDGKDLIFLDPATGRRWEFPPVFRHGLRGVAYSPDGARLLVAQDHGFALLDVAGGRVVRAEEDKDVAEPMAGCFSPTGHLVALAHGRRIDLYPNAPDGVGGRVALPDGPVHDKQVTGAAFHPSGGLLVTCSEDRTAKVWDVAGGKLVATLVADGTNAPLAAFSPDGRHLAVYLGKQQTRLFAVRGLDYRAAVVVGTGPVVAAAVSLSDPARLACVSQNRYAPPEHRTTAELTVWGLPDGAAPTGPGHRRWHPATGDPESINRSPSVAFHPDGSAVAYHGQTGHGFSVLELGTGKAVDYPDLPATDRLTFDRAGAVWANSAYRRDPKTGEFNEVSPKQLISVGFPNLVATTRAESREERILRRFQTFTAVAAGKGRVVAGSRGGVVRVLRPGPDANWTSDPAVGSPSPVRGVALSPDEAAAAWVTEAGDLSVAALSAGPTVVAPPVPLDDVGTAVAYAPDGRLLAAGTAGGRVRLYRVTPGRLELMVELTAPRAVEGVLFTPDGGRMLTFGPPDRGVTVWHLARIRTALREMRLDW